MADEQAVKNQVLIDEMPSKTENGILFADTTALGLSEGSQCVLVNSMESFKEVREVLSNAKRVGLDLIYAGNLISTITIATTNLVAIFDAFTILKEAEVKTFLRDLILVSSVEKVTHSVVHDIPRICKLFKTETEDIGGIIELSELIVEKVESDGNQSQAQTKKYSQQTLAEKYLNLSINKLWNKFNWK